jgi:hypothetical protein
LARADGAHIVLGDIPLKLDQAAPEEIQRPAYRHYFRPVFSQRIDITGRPGAQNLREDRLLWHITDWDGGEGQIVLQNNDDASARKFYRSEGLDFSVPGQVTLNKSINQNTIVDATGGATATSEGSAWSAISGSITDTGTDTELNSTTTVAESESFTPGAGQTSMNFYLYKEGSGTDIEASAMTVEYGSATVSGTDRIIPDSLTKLKTANLLTGTAFTAGVPISVTASATSGSSTLAYIEIVRVYSTYTDTFASVSGTINSSTPLSTSFTPASGATYFFRFKSYNSSSLVLDKVTYGDVGTSTSVTCTVYNFTDTATVSSSTFSISNTATALSKTITFNSTAAKAYRARVTYNSGDQHPLVDKATTVVAGTTAIPLGMLELGLDGKVIAMTTTATTPEAYNYNFTDEDWDALNTGLGDFAAGAQIQAMAHTETYQYAASTVDVIQFTGSGDNDYIADLAGIAGIAICQDRLFVLTVHATNFVDMTTYAVDADVSGGVTAATATAVTGVSAAVDTTLKQQMVGTNTGARWFLNLSDVDAVIYESNIATGTCVTTEIARLPKGTKATAITDVGGYTFVAGQYLAETGETARCALFLIDDDNIPTKVADFRKDDPTAAVIAYMQPYQNDIWLLQGKYIWRYSLQTGGVFCEYELAPGEEAAARALAVVQGHVFALYYRQDSTNTGGVIWVSNTDGLYRQASISAGNSFTSSIYDYGLPGELKTMKSITVITDEMPASTSVVVEAQFDQDGTWVDVGTHTTGSESSFSLATPDTVYEFRTVQLRVTLNTLTGANTPTLKAVVAEALVLGFEEFFECIVLTDDEDSSFHVAGQNRTGGDVVQAVNALRRSQVPFTFTDAYEHSNLDNNSEYSVVFDTSDGTNDEVGEGRLSVRLRVL